jgi:hypothetical protein
MDGMRFETRPRDASHRLELAVGVWAAVLLGVATIAWGGMALSALAALFARR